MTRSFSLGPAAAVTSSAPGACGSGATDAIRRPDPSGSCGVEVRVLTASAAASVTTSMHVTFRASPGGGFPELTDGTDNLWRLPAHQRPKPREPSGPPADCHVRAGGQIVGRNSCYDTSNGPRLSFRAARGSWR